MRCLFCILLLILSACGKSGSGGVSALSHDIVGSWIYPSSGSVLTFEPNRTLTETMTYSGENCTLTASYTFDVSDTTLSVLQTGLSKSNDAACEASCQSRVGQSCSQGQSLLLYLPSRSSNTFSISGSVLSLNGARSYNRN